MRALHGGGYFENRVCQSVGRSHIAPLINTREIDSCSRNRRLPDATISLSAPRFCARPDGTDASELFMKY